MIKIGSEIFGGVIIKINSKGVIVLKKGVEVLYTQAEVEKECAGK
jgi:hypothetical protein